MANTQAAKAVTQKIIFREIITMQFYIFATKCYIGCFRNGIQCSIVYYTFFPFPERKVGSDRLESNKKEENSNFIIDTSLPCLFLSFYIYIIRQKL